MTKTNKTLLTTFLSVAILGAFLGWRGSKLAQRTETAALNRTLQNEVQLSAEVVASHIAQFETDVFNVISAEHWQHSSHAASLTPEFLDSSLYAVGLLEIKTDGYAPMWWSVTPKARGMISAELLRSYIPDWESTIRQMGRHYFIRTTDLQQAPLMIFLSRIQLPNAQGPAIAIAALSPAALKLSVQTVGDTLLWDQQGYIWGYRNSSYVGSILKNDPMVRLSLRSDEADRLQFNQNGHARLGMFTHIPDSNLLIGLNREIPSLADMMLNWWSSLVIGLMGACALGFGLVRWYGSELETEELAPITVRPPDVRPMPKPEIDPSRLTAMPLREPILEEPEAVEAPEPNRIETPIAAAPVSEPINESFEEEEPREEILADATKLDVVLRRALMTFRLRIGDEGVTLSEKIGSNIQVAAKGAQLQTAIEEILKNALDSMKESSIKNLFVEAAREGNTARITIGDTGIGIEYADQERIFEPFFTTKPEPARGLGLTVVKRLMEIVHGETRVESNPGEGTLFKLEIPVLGTYKTVSDSTIFSRIEELSVQQVREFADHVEIRRPRVRMDHTPVRGPRD